MQKQLVDDWIKNNKGGVYLLDHEKNVYVDFSKILNLPDNYSELNTFVLNRNSFKTRANKICGYANYFFEFYNDDNVFLENLFMIKTLVDDKTRKLKIKTLIKLIQKYLITVDIQEKIWEMVEDNYLYILDKTNPLSDISKDTNNRDEYYRYQIISDINGKRLMCSVIAINLIYPLITHYTYKRNKKDDDLFQYFSPFIDLFSTDEVDNIQKLSMYTWSVISVHANNNKTLWRHRAMLGDMGKEEFYDLCLRKHVVTDSVPWLVFDNNMGAFLQKILQEQIGYYIRDEYNVMPIELETTKQDDEGFSEMEMFENRLSKIDESLIILSEENVSTVIGAIKSRFNMNITDKEIRFYEDNIHFSKDQHIMINYHFAKYFNGYRDLKLISKRTFVELAIIMKMRLISQGMVYLPYLLTGNLKNKGRANKISANKVLKKVVESSYYKELMNSKFGFLVDSKNYNPILKLLRSIISSTYTYVDYDNDGINGKDIEFDLETLIYEFLQFIDQI